MDPIDLTLEAHRTAVVGAGAGELTRRFGQAEKKERGEQAYFALLGNVAVSSLVVVDSSYLRVIGRLDLRCYRFHYCRSIGVRVPSWCYMRG